MAKKYTIFTKLLVVTLLLLSAVFTLSPDRAEAATKSYKVTSTTLNVRTGPSVNYKVLFALKKNNTVTYQSKKGTWFKIKSGSKTGYVSSKYLKPVKKPSVSTNSTPAVTTYYYITEPTGLSMRSGAGVSYKALGKTIPFEKRVQILKQKSNGWIQVKYGTKTGWINGSNAYGFKSTKKFSFTSEKEVVKSYLVMDGNSLNVRKMPNVAAPSIGKVGLGFTAKILRMSSNGWAEVQFSNKEKGWVSTNTDLTIITESIDQVGDEVTDSLKGLTFVVDAGHGNHDGGSYGVDLNGNKVNEKTLNLKAAQAIQVAIQNAGGRVLMTRNGDTFLTLDQRAKYASKNGGNAFISVHHNSASSSATGFESFYSNKTNSKEFAKAVHEGVVDSIKEEYPGYKDRTLKAYDFYVVRYNSVFATLLELGFMSNKTELTRLNTDKFRTTVADGVVTGLKTYYGRD